MNMLRFVKKNPTAFKNVRFTYPGIFSIMKICGALFTAAANIMIIMRSESIEDVIKDFIAVEVIIEVDDIFAATLSYGGELLESFIWVDKMRMQLPDTALMDIYVKERKETEVLQELGDDWTEVPRTEGK